MSYQVLARKWRPRTFSEMVGQEHVLRALINALDNDRVHHAFLFTGTRGVGKTTVARILAKALNCEVAVSSQPCGVCGACREIDEGRFVDLIEVDAASRTKVEDTRELLENVQYAPTCGRYKVYLIDEVHMLSAHSFNALLKTLEEPPPHVKFLLATTDPQRLPVTVLSRCLQFNLKRLAVEAIAKQIEHILAQEGLDSEAPARLALARAADGSLRDALSLLDQAIAYGGGTLRAADVRTILGSIEQDHVVVLLEALANNDARALLVRIETLAEQAADFEGVLAELISLLHKVALTQIAPHTLDNAMEHAEAIVKLAQALAPEDVQLFYQIALIGRRDLPLAPDARRGFEMVVLRMLAFRPLDEAAPGARERAQAAPAAAPVGNPAPRPREAAPTRAESVAPAPPVQASEPTNAALPAASNATLPAASAGHAQEWGAVVSALKLGGVARELAVNCSLQQLTSDSVSLVLDPAHGYLRGKSAEERLQQALQGYYGAPLALTISVATPLQETPALQRARAQSERQQAALQAIQSDANVKHLCATFNASVDPEAVQPLD